MTAAMNLSVICTRCKVPFGYHVRRRCPYAPTKFKQHRCPKCNKPVRSHNKKEQDGRVLHTFCHIIEFKTLTMPGIGIGNLSAVQRLQIP